MAQAPRRLILIIWLAVIASVAAVDVIVIGGGMGGLSTALAAVNKRLSVLVLEQGSICGQGATAAAKQGQVNAFQPSTPAVLSGWSHSFSWRWDSRLIYERMQALGYDLGWTDEGGAQVFDDSGNILQRFWTHILYFGSYLALRLGMGTADRFVGGRAWGQVMGISSSGEIWSGRKGHVEPCKVLAAWRKYVEGDTSSVVMEHVSISGISYDAANENQYQYSVKTADGATHHSKVLVIAVGTYHNAFMQLYFPASCAAKLVVRAVAGQIGIYSVDPPIPSRVPIIDSTDAPLMVVGIRPAPTNPCTSFSPRGAEGFTTNCGGQSWAHYLYSTQWGSTFSVGTRRMPIQNPEDCHGPSYQAPNVPWTEEQHAWAYERTSEVFQLKGRSIKRLENYSACFPVADDGQLWVRELGCDGYQNLYVLNGLAGGGIARGPAAGAYMAELIAEALRKGGGVEEEAFRTLRQSYFELEMWLVFNLLVICCFCVCCCYGAYNQCCFCDARFKRKYYELREELRA